jgi:DNA (cytosine-5)-methyltransferase 1
VKQTFIHGIGGPVQGLVVDLFAGGGGASTGIEQAIGRAVDIAINHDPAAIQMHEANHPGTYHRCESIFDVDPVQATQGQPVALLWASPSCTHFSRARGGTPVSKQLRGLGWMVLRWAGKARPAVIVCENVAEWETWGPVRRGQPWKRRRGAYWNLFLASLRRLGYAVEWRVLDAAEHGAPTHRRRLFLVARCDGQPIVWPAPICGPKASKPFRTAAECIDWSDLGRSIFDRKKPLAAATCRRIAAGIVRYVLGGKPFIIEIDNRSNGLRAVRDPAAPLTTITTENRHALVAAFLAKHFTGVIGQPMDRPMGTVTAVDHHSLVAATMIQTGYGERAGQAPRCLDIEKPLGAIVAGGAKHALCAAFLTTYYSGGGSANAIDAPVPAIVTKARHGLVTVDIDGTTYALADIRLRMLKPAELARAQGFPAGYSLTGTQAQQIGRIGNSVCPPVAAALVRANLVGGKAVAA